MKKVASKRSDNFDKSTKFVATIKCHKRSFKANNKSESPFQQTVTKLTYITVNNTFN
jgi:hypothetical protein